MSSKNKNEQLIQSGFELIVKAFDDQAASYKATIVELKKQIEALLQENECLRDENTFYQKEIQKLRETNKKISISFEANKKKLSLIRESILEDPVPMNKGLGKNSFLTTTNLTTDYRMTENDFNKNELSSDDNGLVLHTQYSFTKKKSEPFNSKPNYNSMNSSFSQGKNGSSNRKKKEDRRYSENKEKDPTNDFLVLCKEQLNNKNFEKILLLFNNHKSGLISSYDIVARIREILHQNPDLLNLFNRIINSKK